jgi:cytosine/adenosine deaminase-related metal-dependent hydrolase
MLVSADWVLPIEAPPIRRGAVLVVNGRVARVGALDAFADVPERMPRVDLEGCILLPGLVNAHTHLSLTALEGLVPSADFTTWLGRVVPAIRGLDPDDMAASAALGALRSIAGGVTAVGDIAYGPEAGATASDLGLAGVFFWEVLGVPAGALHRVLHGMEFPERNDHGRRGRDRIGLSPHTPYTSGPGLLQAVAQYARENGFPLAVHVAESIAESQLTRHGTGPLLDVASRTAEGFEVPHTSPVSYLARLGVLDDALAVHCVHLAPGDAATLAEKARGVVLCPRSNAFLHNGFPPVDSLERAGATLALGTDSAASNEGSLDLFAEARALRDVEPSLSPSRLLRMLTIEGARTLGVDSLFGSLVQGKQADLVAVRVGTTEDPVGAVIDHGAPEAVEAVATAGVWRIREGRPTFPDAPIERAATVAVEHARAALEGRR